MKGKCKKGKCKPPKYNKATWAKVHKPSKPKVARCFKCEHQVEPSCVGDVWESPWPAEVFHDGGNFGSTLYERAFDGIGVDLIVCDECLIKHNKLVRVTKTVHCHRDRMEKK